MNQILFNNNPTMQDVQRARLARDMVIVKLPTRDSGGIDLVNPHLRMEIEFRNRGLLTLTKDDMQHLLFLFSDTSQEEFERWVLSRVSCAEDLLAAEK